MQAMSLLKLTSSSSAGVEDDKEELAKKRSEVTELLFESMPSRIMEVLDAGKVLPLTSLRFPGLHCRNAGCWSGCRRNVVGVRPFTSTSSRASRIFRSGAAACFCPHLIETCCFVMLRVSQNVESYADGDGGGGSRCETAMLYLERLRKSLPKEVRHPACPRRSAVLVD